VGHPTKKGTDCWYFFPEGTLKINDAEEVEADRICIRCGDEMDIFCNTDEYRAYECLGCRIAYRRMSDGEIQIIRGYNGVGLEDFDWVTGALIVDEEEAL
jgi:hypothetical protein